MVVNELATVSGKWENLGQHFGIPSGYLDDIRTRYPNPADGMKELIKLWLQQEYHESSFRGLTTWNHVVLALKSPEVGESQLGENLKQKYLPGELFNAFTIAALVSQVLGDPVMELYYSNYGLLWWHGNILTGFREF